MKRILLGALSAFFAVGVGCSTAKYAVSDHYDGEEFFDANMPMDKGFLDVLKWRLLEDREEWPEWLDDNATPAVASHVDEKTAHITFVNHATVLVQLPGFNILTDPIYSERASPVSFAGPQRHRAPGIPFEKLPPIHAVVVSHNHYDHLDLETLKRLSSVHKPLFLVPLGNKALLESEGISTVVELDWWQAHQASDGLTITAVPLQHWSARSLFDRNEVLWAGYVMQAGGLKVYFGGDTGYGPHYLAASKRLGTMDVSLLPIGAYEPRWFMKDQHMNPADAVQAHLDLSSRFSVGIHFGTFQLTDEGIERPRDDLRWALARFGVPPENFAAPRNGETMVFSR